MRRTRLRWRRLAISSQSRHSPRTVLTNRSAMAFAWGACTGVLTIRMLALRNTSSKAPLYLPSRSRTRKRRPWSARSRPRLRACWVTHEPVGPNEQPASQTRRFACDEEQDVVPAQEHALDREELAGNDALRLGAQELAPTRTRLARSRPQS